MKTSILTPLKRKRIDAFVAKVDTGELPAVLSKDTVRKIERNIPVSYQSAAIYCKSLGLDPYEYIIKERKISILEPIIED